MKALSWAFIPCINKSKYPKIGSTNLCEGKWLLVPVLSRKLNVVILPTSVVQYCKQPFGGLNKYKNDKSLVFYLLLWSLKNIFKYLEGNDKLLIQFKGIFVFSIYIKRNAWSCYNAQSSLIKKNNNTEGRTLVSHLNFKLVDCLQCFKCIKNSIVW